MAIAVYSYIVQKIQKINIYVLGGTPFGSKDKMSWARGTVRGSPEVYYAEFI